MRSELYEELQQRSFDAKLVKAVAVLAAVALFYMGFQVTIYVAAQVGAGM